MRPRFPTRSTGNGPTGARPDVRGARDGTAADGRRRPRTAGIELRAVAPAASSDCPFRSEYCLHRPLRQCRSRPDRSWLSGRSSDLAQGMERVRAMLHLVERGHGHTVRARRRPVDADPLRAASREWAASRSAMPCRCALQAPAGRRRLPMSLGHTVTSSSQLLFWLSSSVRSLQCAVGGPGFTPQARSAAASALCSRSLHVRCARRPQRGPRARENARASRRARQSAPTRPPAPRR
jgi:hypothetical protein